MGTDRLSMQRADLTCEGLAGLDAESSQFTVWLGLQVAEPDRAR